MHITWWMKLHGNWNGTTVSCKIWYSFKWQTFQTQWIATTLSQVGFPELFTVLSLLVQILYLCSCSLILFLKSTENCWKSTVLTRQVGELLHIVVRMHYPCHPSTPSITPSSHIGQSDFVFLLLGQTQNLGLESTAEWIGITTFLPCSFVSFNLPPPRRRKK